VTIYLGECEVRGHATYACGKKPHSPTDRDPRMTIFLVLRVTFPGMLEAKPDLGGLVLTGMTSVWGP
jgi:hypothetical protein